MVYPLAENGSVPCPALLGLARNRGLTPRLPPRLISLRALLVPPPKSFCLSWMVATAPSGPGLSSGPIDSSHGKEVFLEFTADRDSLLPKTLNPELCPSLTFHGLYCLIPFSSDHLSPPPGKHLLCPNIPASNLPSSAEPSLSLFPTGPSTKLVVITMQF